MRISKADATEVAEKMTKKHSEEIASAKKELQELGVALAIKHTPDSIIEFSKKHPGWIRTSGDINVNGVGLQYERVSLGGTFRIPCKDYCPTYVLSDKDATSVRKLVDKISLQKKQLEKLQSDIQNAIVGLGTYSKITEQFPEAAAHLPVKIRTEIAINLKDIRKALK